MNVTLQVFRVERADGPQKKISVRSFVFLHWFFSTTGVKKVSEYERSTGEPILSTSHHGNWKKGDENFVERLGQNEA